MVAIPAGGITLPRMKELERFTPGLEGRIWYEHWHRYHFAARFAAGRTVIDAACGEGYGSALLARTAACVTGIDSSAEAIAMAQRRYGACANLEFREGRCEALPVPDASMDLVVSFETLEHLQEPRALLREAARVLRDDGVLMVSTPNKQLYTDASGYRNPFHPSEMYEAEFVAALRERFAAVALFGQRVDVYSAIWPLAQRAADPQLLRARAGAGAEAAEGIPDPMYFIAVCAPTRAALERIGAPVSLLADEEHRVWSNCESVEQLLADARVHVERVEKAYLEAQRRLAMLLQERERRAASPAPAPAPWPPR